MRKGCNSCRRHAAHGPLESHCQAAVTFLDIGAFQRKGVAEGGQHSLTWSGVGLPGCRQITQGPGVDLEDIDLVVLDSVAHGGQWQGVSVARRPIGVVFRDGDGTRRPIWPPVYPDEVL